MAGQDLFTRTLENRTPPSQQRGEFWDALKAYNRAPAQPTLPKTYAGPTFVFVPQRAEPESQGKREETGLAPFLALGALAGLFFLAVKR